ncbi:MAG: hypothetical protein ACXVFQ_24385 [Solirubrobacteraceae bacterium]
MIGRIGRVVGGAVVATALMCVVPALASAAQSLGVSSTTGFPAGGDPSYTTTINLDTSAGAPGKVTIALAPGALASVAANPSCSTGAPQYTSACQIGTGSATVLGLVPASLNAYLVPPPASADLVGIDLVPSPNLGLIPTTHIGGQLVQTASGNVQVVLGLDLSSLGSTASLLTKMSLTINGTLNGKPFTRMPTNCSPGSSTITIAYANKTETSTASPDFKPTGCASLPFAPTVTGSAVEDLNDQGVAVSTTVTQAPNEAASASTGLVLPSPTLTPNFNSVPLQNSATPVGNATVNTPLLATPLQGQAYLTGELTAPTLTLRFPPPAALTLTGTISLAQHTVTFLKIPDVPVTKLTVSLVGGPKSLLNGACTTPTGQLAGAFIGQNGKRATAQKTLTISGCSGVSVGTGNSGGGGSGSGGSGNGGGSTGGGTSGGGKTARLRVSGFHLSGIARGKPSVSFTITRGAKAPKLGSFTITLPSGLRFVRRRLAAGIHIGPAHALQLHNGRLTVTLKRAVNSVTVRMGVPALAESAQLRRHPKHRLIFRVS